MIRQLAFKKSVIENGAVSLVPEIEGITLTEIVARCEAGVDDGPVGGYGGIVPQHFRFGDLSKFYLGIEDKQWPAPGEVWLLGCECGEVRCWPLSARIASLMRRLCGRASVSLTGPSATTRDEALDDENVINF